MSAQPDLPAARTWLGQAFEDLGSLAQAVTPTGGVHDGISAGHRATPVSDLEALRSGSAEHPTEHEPTTVAPGEGRHPVALWWSRLWLRLSRRSVE